MASYSSWNGIKMHAHKFLLTNFLKGTLRFRGFIISVWQGVDMLTYLEHSNYSDSLQKSINASVEMPIHLKGDKYLLQGRIDVTLNENLPENVPLDILDNKGNVVDTTIATRVTEPDQLKNAAYEYYVWASFGEALIIVPRDSRTDGRKKILFYPRQQHVLVSKDGCQVPVPSFSGRLGFYIEGSVSPPLPDVQI